MPQNSRGRFASRFLTALFMVKVNCLLIRYSSPSLPFSPPPSLLPFPLLYLRCTMSCALLVLPGCLLAVRFQLCVEWCRVGWWYHIWVVVVQLLAIALWCRQLGGGGCWNKIASKTSKPSARNGRMICLGVIWLRMGLNPIINGL